MIVFADNDLILKLAQCDLLDSLPQLFETEISDIYIPSTAKFQLLPKNPEKALSKCGNEETLTRIKRFIGSTQDVPTVENLELLTRLSATPGIHAGEQQLFAAMVGAEDTFMLTGDRNALRAVIASKETNDDLYNSMIDRVVTFESALLIALNYYGFTVLKQKLLSCPKPDGVLKLVVDSEMSEHTLRECLVSYSREVFPFLAMKCKLPDEFHANDE